MRHNLTLFTGTDDLLSHRARFVLAIKNVEAEIVEVDPANPPEELRKLNPYHSVPTIVSRELVLYSACVVTEYLDERYPHPPLMPVDPLSRARLRLSVLRMEHDWVPKVYAIQHGSDEQAAVARKQLAAEIAAAVPLFKASKYFLNPELSLADALVAPILWRLETLGVPLPNNSKPIEDYMAKVFKLPAWNKSLTEQERELRVWPKPVH